MEEHLKEMMEEIKQGKAQLFDVREKDEWDEGHLKISQLIPLSDLMEGDITSELNKELPTYLHCRSGNRVHTAGPILQDLGFKNIIPLSEGFDDLVDEGFEVE